MPRDSTGNYSLPAGTLVNTGDTVLVSQHNPAMSDIGAGLTKSLDRDGSGGMRADLDMGTYKIVNVAPGTDPDDVATVAQLGDSITVPLGAVLDYWGTTPPEGFLLCYGQEIARADYADLFAVIGTSAGAGNGSTTFNLPDYRGRAGAGKDNMGGSTAGRLTAASGVTGTTLGATGGAETHTLTSAQMPAHTHSTTGAVDIGSGFVSGGPTPFPYPFTASSPVTGSTGGGTAHNNVQPVIIANKIMKCTN